jgi:L-cysteine desulfidase
MSTAGSGNHGIRVFFTIFAVEEKRNLSREKLIKSLVLSNLITFFIKACTAEIGASAGVVYLLDGEKINIRRPL